MTKLKGKALLFRFKTNLQDMHRWEKRLKMEEKKYIISDLVKKLRTPYRFIMGLTPEQWAEIKENQNC
jgi:hypothetical protein